MSKRSDFIATAVKEAPRGGLVQRSDAPLPVPAQTHPMAVGLKEAKQLIARILESKPNLKKLERALQREFTDNPTKFFRAYEPLLRRYEEADKLTKNVGVPVHISGPTLINMGGANAKEEADYAKRSD